MIKKLKNVGQAYLEELEYLFYLVNVWMWESLLKTWWKMEWGKTGKVNIEDIEKG